MVNGEDDIVWELLIENTGAADRVLHTSLHSNIKSGITKATNVLTYTVPDREEWYTRQYPNEGTISRIGYVLDRDEINTWPIRIEITRTDVLDET